MDSDISPIFSPGDIPPVSDFPCVSRRPEKFFSSELALKSCTATEPLLLSCDLSELKISLVARPEEWSCSASCRGLGRAVIVAEECFADSAWLVTSWTLRPSSEKLSRFDCWDVSVFLVPGSGETFRFGLYSNFAPLLLGSKKWHRASSWMSLCSLFHERIKAFLPSIYSSLNCEETFLFAHREMNSLLSSSSFL